MTFQKALLLAAGIAAGCCSFAGTAADPAKDLGLPAPAAAAMNGIDAGRIRATVRFLSDDLLEGRGTGTRGGDIAAKYIAAQFALYGLKPAGDGGDYLQKVDFTGVQTLPATTVSLQPDHGAALVLKLGEDYVHQQPMAIGQHRRRCAHCFRGLWHRGPRISVERFQGCGRQGQGRAGHRQRTSLEGSKVLQRGNP